jgi:hypothetical protein
MSIDRKARALAREAKRLVIVVPLKGPPTGSRGFRQNPETAGDTDPVQADMDAAVAGIDWAAFKRRMDASYGKPDNDR